MDKRGLASESLSMSLRKVQSMNATEPIDTPINERFAGPVAEAARLSDAELVRAIMAHDRDAFTALMRRFNRLLYRTARSIVRDDFDAEDVVQNAYLLAYRDISKFRGEAKLSTWLVRIVINEALACLRRRTRSANILSLEDDACDGAVDAAYESTRTRPERPDEAAMRSDLRRLLEAKIDELPLPRRSVFILRVLEELSVAETAVMLGIREATVRTRFFRAREQLSAALPAEAAEGLRDAFAFAGARCDRIVAGVLASITGIASPHASPAAVTTVPADRGAHMAQFIRAP
jgi:RNA polymerase sigma-70 factor (ECF subfamily)